MLFVRRCEGLGPYCEGETKREIVCNAEFCDNSMIFYDYFLIFLFEDFKNIYLILSF